MSGKTTNTRTTRAKLHKLVWSKPLGEAAPSVGMSANGLAKLCDRLAIPRPPRSYWTRNAADRPAVTPLGPAPEGADEAVVFGERQRASVRPRTRLSPKDRLDDLADHAAALATAEGVEAVTLRRVAQAAGISEAQAHNCFAGRVELLLHLARREIAALEALRRRRMARGHDRFASAVISTITYLHEAKERGPLLQILLRSPEVRDGLRDERRQAAERGRAPILRALSERRNMDRAVANASTAALTALSLRAGGLVASRRVDLATAEGLCLAVIMAGMRSNSKLAESSAG